MMESKVKNKWFMIVVMICLTMTVSKSNAADCLLDSLKERREFQSELAERTVEISRALVKFNSLFQVENGSQLANINIVNAIYRNLSATCRRYTDVLAYKYQFQKQLFKNASQENNVLLLLTSLVSNLQALAMKLQEIEMKAANSYCASFTLEQYALIYSTRLYSNNGFVKSVVIIAGTSWQNANDPCINYYYKVTQV